MAGTVAPAFIKHKSRGVVRLAAAITTDASGDAPATVIGVGYGKIVGLFYDGGLDASAVLTFKDAKSGATLFTYTTGTEGTPTTIRPTTNVVDVAGAVVSAADTAPNIWRGIKVAGKITLTVASGGNAETGTVALIVDESNLGDIALTV